MKSVKKTVFVGVSGGVDSSVSAALLKKQGYNVVGVFIRTWSPDFIKCTWKEERRDAIRVCAHLNIPFMECDAEEVYRDEVALYMIEEYKKGRTPNPDVMCNRKVKFGVFWDFAKKHGADYIATGHYAEVFHSHSFSQSSLSLSARFARSGAPTPVAFGELCELHKGVDNSKDQSYFLWTLTKEDLAHTLFPIGYLKKTNVRKLAKKFKIPVAEKKDSQGVCFLGPLNMKDFLSHYMNGEKGDVLDEKGEVIGYHNGSLFFTIGERHGFIITKKTEKDKPYYVISKNIDKNTITVSDKTFSDSISSRTIKLEKTNWISSYPEENKKYTAQIRYHGENIECKIKILRGDMAEIIFDKNVLVDSGQSVVVYDIDNCVGGGVVI